MDQPYEVLEREWAKWNGLDDRGMVACASGTAALHLALECMGLPKESQVIVPDFTMIACPRAVSLAGLTPIFVDCGEDLLADPNLVREAIGDHQRSLMAVHIYGRRFNFDAVYGPGTRKPATAVIEDLSEAHGVSPNKYTDAACWSFYRNKIVAGEEGGAIWFRDNALAKVARSLRSLGDGDNHDFWHAPRGHNYRMSNLHAAAILNSLAKVATNVQERRRIENEYNEYCPDWMRMPPRDQVWVYDIKLPNPSCNVPMTVRKLNEKRIAARQAFKACSRQIEYLGSKPYGQPDASGWTKADRAGNEVMYLPCTPGQRIDARQVFEVIKEINKL